MQVRAVIRMVWKARAIEIVGLVIVAAFGLMGGVYIPADRIEALLGLYTLLGSMGGFIAGRMNGAGSGSLSAGSARGA